LLLILLSCVPLLNLRGLLHMCAMRKHAESEDEGMLRVTRTGVAALPYSRRVVAEEDANACARDKP